jgi:3' terminal RNA ribose 2'-O-methyltransferase Hen1
MLLTITYTRPPATDLGYLLYKNPVRPQSFELAFGKAHVFYPEVSKERCTAALLLDIDPVDLARGHRRPGGEGLFDYVNDRPYVASSFLSVAISRVFGTAMSGRSKDRPELVEAALPFEVRITMLPCRGDEDIIRRLFEPLGYKVTVQGYTLDEKFPGWGESGYFTVDLAAHCRLRDLLSHIYVLVPVLDQEKHYWVGEDEVKKLLRHGAGWLAEHPEREMITTRYLRRQCYLINQALNKLMEEESPDPEETIEELDTGEEVSDKNLNLNQQRIGNVVSVLKSVGARRVIDLGCGEGNLLELLHKDKHFTEITGVDVSPRSLERAKGRLKLDRLPDKQRERITLFQGSLTYRDKRFKGYDAATVTEVIEHLDQNRLGAFERVIFEFARPATVIITTPNKEYNVRYENLLTGDVRHRDHRFEWSRWEFQDWAENAAGRFGYSVRFLPIGEEDPELGAPTQMGVFTL